jgi:hypothetical protein
MWSPSAGSGPSFPLARENLRDTAKDRVSISTNWSSIMQPWYWKSPVASTRLPCGMVHVTIRATSVLVGVCTTEIDDGTMSPCRLKFEDSVYSPSGVTSIDAGKLPSRSPGPVSVSGPSS